MRRWTRAASAALVLGLFLVPGCGEDVVVVNQENPLVLTQNGWFFFDQGSFVTAANRFRRAVILDRNVQEAWVGLGWSLALLDSLPQAIVAFDSSTNAAQLIEQTHFGAIPADRFAGRAVVYRELPGPTSLMRAVTNVDSTLAQAPRYEFLHPPQLDYLDLRLLRAEANFYLSGTTPSLIGDVQADIDFILDDLDQARDFPNPGSETYRDTLLVELERLSTLLGVGSN